MHRLRGLFRLLLLEPASGTQISKRPESLSHFEERAIASDEKCELHEHSRSERSERRECESVILRSFTPNFWSGSRKLVHPNFSRARLETSRTFCRRDNFAFTFQCRAIIVAFTSTGRGHRTKLEGEASADPRSV